MWGWIIIGFIVVSPFLTMLIVPKWVERQERKNPKQAAYMRRVDDELTAKGL